MKTHRRTEKNLSQRTNKFRRKAVFNLKRRIKESGRNFFTARVMLTDEKVMSKGLEGCDCIFYADADFIDTEGRPWSIVISTATITHGEAFEDISAEEVEKEFREWCVETGRGDLGKKFIITKTSYELNRAVDDAEKIFAKEILGVETLLCGAEARTRENLIKAGDTECVPLIISYEPWYLRGVRLTIDKGYLTEEIVEEIVEYLRHDTLRKIRFIEAGGVCADVEEKARLEKGIPDFLRNHSTKLLKNLNGFDYFAKSAGFWYTNAVNTDELG